MIPVGEAGYEHALEIGHDDAEGFGILRRLRGKGVANCTGCDAGEHRIPVRVLEVVGNPLDELVTVPSECRRVHV